MGFHAQRFHRWQFSPNKHVQRVRFQAFQKIKELWSRFKGYANSRKTEEPSQPKVSNNNLLIVQEILKNWRELSFPTSKAAHKALTMVLRSTPKETRAWMTQESRNSNAIQDSREDTDTSLDRIVSFLITFCNLIANISSNTPIPLSLHPELPHINLPINIGQQTSTLTVALDSCAGVNLGDLRFHQAMAIQHPELVQVFKPVSDYQKNDIVIGSADKGNLLNITHIISYKTPYRVNGAQINVAIGLSLNAAATALLSIDFLRKMKALWNFDNMASTIHFGTINKTFPIEYQVLERRVLPIAQAPTKTEIDVITVLDENRGFWKLKALLTNLCLQF